LVGRLGTGKVLIVPTGQVSRGEPVWQIFLGEWPRDALEVHADLANVENRKESASEVMLQLPDWLMEAVCQERP
jgi:hypothetical protein